MDTELQRVWQLVQELSEQIDQNNRVATDLQQQLVTLKSQADETSKGLTLRRYNVDVSKESFDSEVERTGVTLIVENQALLQENKQLNILVKEYEQTLDTVMNKFRAHAHAASQHEMTLIGHYETLLVSREGQPSTQTYDLYTLGASLERLQTNIRQALRCTAGLGTNADDPPGNNGGDQRVTEGGTESDQNDLEALASALEGKEKEGTDEEDLLAVDWAYEREVEISRLEKENEEMRKQLGILRPPDEQDDTWKLPSWNRQGSANGGQRHARTSSVPFGLGITTSQTGAPPYHLQSSQSNPFTSTGYGIAFPPAGGPNSYQSQTQTHQQSSLPPANRNQPKSVFFPPRGSSLPTVGAVQGLFGDTSSGAASQRPSAPVSGGFYRPIPSREKIDLTGGHLL